MPAWQRPVYRCNRFNRLFTAQSLFFVDCTRSSDESWIQVPRTTIVSIAVTDIHRLFIDHPGCMRHGGGIVFADQFFPESGMTTMSSTLSSERYDDNNSRLGLTGYPSGTASSNGVLDEEYSGEEARGSGCEGIINTCSTQLMIAHSKARTHPQVHSVRVEERVAAAARVTAR